MILEVKVIPQAKLNEIVEFKEGVLKIKIKGTPIKGKVNKNLINFLAEFLNVPKTQIKIISGLTSRRKRIEITGLKNTLAEFLSKMNI